jgi:hypothetical protein
VQAWGYSGCRNICQNVPPANFLRIAVEEVDRFREARADPCLSRSLVSAQAAQLFRDTIAWGNRIGWSGMVSVLFRLKPDE